MFNESVKLTLVTLAFTKLHNDCVRRIGFVQDYLTLCNQELKTAQCRQDKGWAQEVQTRKIEKMKDFQAVCARMDYTSGVIRAHFNSFILSYPDWECPERASIPSIQLKYWAVTYDKIKKKLKVSSI